MKKHTVTQMIAILMAAVLLNACSDTTQTTNTATTEASEASSMDLTENTAGTESSVEVNSESSSDSDTYLFTDSAGREVKLPKNITRIAPSGLLAQIVLFAIAPDALVGLSGQWTDNASQYLNSRYLELPVFGQFYGSGDLNMEAVAAADPQVIIDIGEAKDSIVEDMDSIQEQLGIPTIFAEASLASMSDCYRTLGQVLGTSEEGNALADYCDAIYQNTKDKMDTISDDKKVNLLYCLGDTGTNVIAKGSFHAEVLDLLANNVAVIDDPSSSGSGNEVSMEQLYLWESDMILFAPGSVYDSVGTDSVWTELKAVSDGQYYEVPNGPYNWMGFPPSVNRYIGMIWLSNLLYPDVFDYNLYEETLNYYQLFYHCDLTKEQYDTLTQNSLQAD